jgi:hypothetical protein
MLGVSGGANDAIRDVLWSFDFFCLFEARATPQRVVSTEICCQVLYLCSGLSNALSFSNID